MTDLARSVFPRHPKMQCPIRLANCTAILRVQTWHSLGPRGINSARVLVVSRLGPLTPRVRLRRASQRRDAGGELDGEEVVDDVKCLLGGDLGLRISG
jgi:hypothetical protein